VKKELISLFAILIMCLSACGIVSDKSEEAPTEKVNVAEDVPLEEQQEKESTYTYRELEKMEEVTVEGDKIIFVLYENQALPYIWKTSAKGTALTLIADETVDGNDLNIFSAGDSPAYHVFIYQWNSDGEAEIELIHARYDDDSRSAAAEIRSLYAEKYGENVLCEEISREYP